MPYVYVLSNPSYLEGTYKIGHTTKTMQERLAGLNNTSVPTPFKVEAQYEVELSAFVEKLVHKHLKPYRLNKGREFFGNGVTLDAIHLAVVHCCDSFGVDTNTPQDMLDITYRLEQSIITKQKDEAEQRRVRKIAKDAYDAEQNKRCDEFILKHISGCLDTFVTYEKAKIEYAESRVNFLWYMLTKAKELSFEQEWGSLNRLEESIRDNTRHLREFRGSKYAQIGQLVMGGGGVIYLDSLIGYKSLMKRGVSIPHHARESTVYTDPLNPVINAKIRQCIAELSSLPKHRKFDTAFYCTSLDEHLAFLYGLLGEK